MVAKTHDGVRHVLFVTFAGFQLLDLAGPMQVFATATEHGRRGPGKERLDYRVSVVSHDGASIAASAGLTIAAMPLPTALPPATTIVVVGGNGVEAAMRDTVLIEWLRARADGAERVCSICNGAFLLASAGLLSGRRATTHWIDCDELQRRHPDIEVDRDAIFVQDGAIWTSAGVSTGIDMALAIVEQDHGSAAAVATARRLVLYVRRPGSQSQFSAFLDVVGRDGEGAFDPLHQWIAANIDADLRVSELARRAAMSERSFSRRYKAAIGMTPAEGVTRLRAEAARHLLVTSMASLKTIAVKTGFGSVAPMNHAHRKVYGLTSKALREIRF